MPLPSRLNGTFHVSLLTSRVLNNPTCVIQRRHKSITSAIERGRRDTTSSFGERSFREAPRSRNNWDEERRNSSRDGGFRRARDSGFGRFEERRQRDGEERFSRGDREMRLSPAGRGGYGDGGKANARGDMRREGRFSRDDRGETPYPARRMDTREERSGESRFSSNRMDRRGAPPTRERFGRDRFDREQPSGEQSSTAPAGAKSTTEALKKTIRGPDSLPYSTAASEFIYGHSSVLAAIKANRRKFYKLYVHSRGASRDGLMAQIRAHKLFPITEEVGDEYLRAMDKASSGRPHNGIILESSPLPVPPITELKTPSMEEQTFSLALGTQSAEDVAVNGRQEVYPYKSDGWRHPLILYVDGVVDEGNLGAIARSAYVLGADAIVTPTHHTANWSQIAVKASAGAAEALPLFKVGEPNDFLGKSSRAGWRIYASDAVPRAPPGGLSSAEATEAASARVAYTIARSTKRLSPDHSPVAEHPTILMMGAEGTGLKNSLLNLAHYKVGIPHGRGVNEVGVDSLNVSVAASILCYEMLQRPIAQPKRDTEEALF